MIRPIIIDVRQPEEYAAGHVSGALNIPPAALMEDAPQLADVPRDAPIILYCRSGQRSNTAMAFLRAQGFTNLTNGINQEQVEARFIR